MHFKFNIPRVASPYGLPELWMLPLNKATPLSDDASRQGSVTNRNWAQKGIAGNIADRGVDTVDMTWNFEQQLIAVDVLIIESVCFETYDKRLTVTNIK